MGDYRFLLYDHLQLHCLLDASPDWCLSEQGPWQEEDGVRYCFATYTRVSA